jgi:hypothetical protein
MKTKKRLKKGSLVASTNPQKAILAKRLVINVYYTELTKRIKYQEITNIRINWEQ